jgi:hypothetical protein
LAQAKPDTVTGQKEHHDGIRLPGFSNRRWITYYARNIREAAKIAVYSFLVADGVPVAVGREQAVRCAIRALGWASVAVHSVDTVKRMAATNESTNPGYDAFGVHLHWPDEGQPPISLAPASWDGATL